MKEFCGSGASSKGTSRRGGRLFASTGTSYLIYPVVLIALSGAVMDLTRGRIYNWLTFPAVLVGLGFCAFTGGWGAVFGSFLGIVVAFVLYGWMFWLNVMGAGDVKLLMALAAFGGVRFAVETGILGILIGGMAAFVALVCTRRIGGLVRRMHRFVLTLLVRELELEVPKVDRSFTMPYGPSIAVAAIVACVWDPFRTWGIF